MSVFYDIDSVPHSIWHATVGLPSTAQRTTVELEALVARFVFGRVNLGGLLDVAARELVRRRAMEAQDG